MPARIRNSTSASRRRCAAALSLISLVTSAAGEAARADLSLEEALGILEREGLTIFYSSALVRPDMRVDEMPTDGSLRDRLDAILASFGLTTRVGPADSVLIVRAPTANAPAGVPTARPVADTVVPSPPPLAEIVVTASRYRLDRSLVASSATLTHDDIEHSPDVGDDALRPVSRLPGAAGNGFSARVNVRGGEVGETLVTFDGLRLYDPYHLRQFQGVFSTIDPRIVDEMTVYAGVFPAEYGDRLSGVIDIESLDAPSDRYHEVSLSFFNASALSAGRFDAGRGEWVASFRRSNLDLLYSAFSEHAERPRYVDAFAKIGYDVNDRLRVSGNVLVFEDDISLADDVDREERAFSDDRDRYGWLRLDHAPAAKLVGATLLAHSHLSALRRGISAKEGISAGMLEDRRSFAIDSVTSDWTWSPSGNLAVRFGGAISRMDGRYDYRDEVEFDLLFEAAGAPVTAIRSRSIEAQVTGDQHALYGSVLYRPARRVALAAGLRWDEQALDPGERSRTLDPRIGIRFSVTEGTVLKLGWGRFHQHQNVTELQIEDGSTGFYEPQQAEQTVVALEHAFGEGPSLRIEAYEKEYTSVRPRHENLLMPLTLLPELKPDRFRISPLRARARGAELLLSGRPSEGLSWWFAYSRSRVEDELSDGAILRAWDQPDAVSAGLSWDSPKWNVGLALVQRSGWPRTSLVAARAETDPPVVVAGARNSARNGAYRSVDFRLTRKFQLQSGSLTAFLEVNNLAGRKNPCCVEYEASRSDTGELELELSPINYLPRLPSIGFVWSLRSSEAGK